MSGEASPQSEVGFLAVAKSGDLPEGGALAVEVGRRSVALFRSRGRVFALDDTCPHSGGPLSEGEVEDGTVTCPWHGARFALENGRSESPIASDVKCSRVREREGMIEVETDARSPSRE